jgi:hypothetical protein
MANAVKNRDAQRSTGELKAYKMNGGELIYKDTIVCLDATGYAIVGGDVAGNGFVGVAYDKADNSAGSDGDLSVRVRKTGEYTFEYSGGDATQAAVGKAAYAVDDSTVDDDASALTNDVVVGKIVEVLSASKVRVLIG